MNQEQYEFVQEKYGNLIYMIAQRISGDGATAEAEDNVQDLWMAAMEAIHGYERQDDGKNGKFEDFKNTKGFDRYIKTCLWHLKAKKGTNVTKKQGITKALSIEGNADSTDDQLMFNIQDPKVTNINVNDEVLEDIRVKLLPQEKLIVKHILEHPDCMKDNGTVNISQIAKSTNMKSYEVEYFVQYIKSRYNMTMM